MLADGYGSLMIVTGNYICGWFNGGQEAIPYTNIGVNTLMVLTSEGVTKWEGWTQTGHRCKLRSGGHDPQPIITALCKQDRSLHVYSSLHFITLGLT